MRRSILILLSILPLAAISAPAKTPLTLPDILAWKRIQTPVVSNDGHWFAYKLTPNDGDSEVILRSLLDGKETRFAIGEMPRPDPNAPPGPPAGGFGARDLAFSEDSKWLALQPYPTVKEAKLLKKTRKPLQAKVTLVELSTAKKLEYEGIRRFAFSGGAFHGDRDVSLSSDAGESCRTTCNAWRCGSEAGRKAARSGPPCP